VASEELPEDAALQRWTDAAESLARSLQESARSALVSSSPSKPAPHSDHGSTLVAALVCPWRRIAARAPGAPPPPDVTLQRVEAAWAALFVHLCRASHRHGLALVAAGRVCEALLAEGAGPAPSRTKWTRRVPHPVLIGHAASLSQVLPRTRRGATSRSDTRRLSSRPSWRRTHGTSRTRLAKARPASLASASVGERPRARPRRGCGRGARARRSPRSAQARGMRWRASRRWWARWPRCWSRPPSPPPLVLSGHAASLTLY